MYHVTKTLVKQDDFLFPYCDKLTHLTNNLRNATLFRVRQVLSFTNKPEAEWSENERSVYHELEQALPLMGPRYKMPSKGKHFLGYTFLDALMRVTHNPDYFCEGLPRQSAQHVLKEVVANMKSFFAALRAYKKDPSAFTGRPKLPKYGKSGGVHKVVLTNQDCVLYPCDDGTREVKFPMLKERLNIGRMPINGRLKQVEIIPSHGMFVLCFTWDDANDVLPLTSEPQRVCAIDLGVNNVAAITNNSGLPCLLFKGGVAKSINQYYNKQVAKIMSEQTKGTTGKFVPTPEYYAICQWRENHINDYLNKVAVRIIVWCQEYAIDTIVIGVNKFWKQKVKLGKVTNQNFVQLPLERFRRYIQYRAERVGIAVIEQEESYTSQASFLDGDAIPVYDPDATDENGERINYVFSGRRFSRGLYRSSDGTILNADLNTSANIMRKALPETLQKSKMPDFGNVIVIHHPNMEMIRENRIRQLATAGNISNAKQKRLNRKQNKVILMG